MRLLLHQIFLLALEGRERIGGRQLPSKGDALQGLRRLTGEDFGYDALKWREWLNSHRKEFNALLKPQVSGEQIPKDWISTRLSSPEAVARNVGPLPILQMFKQGDELRRFRSPKANWRLRGGREGLVLIREGVVIAAVLLRIN